MSVFVQVATVCKVTTVCCLQEVPGRDVHAYLALPPSEYNLLDGQYVQYIGSNQFQVTFPLAETFGLQLTPEITLEVQPDEANARVRPTSSSLSIML